MGQNNNDMPIKYLQIPYTNKPSLIQALKNELEWHGALPQIPSIADTQEYKDLVKRLDELYEANKVDDTEIQQLQVAKQTNQGEILVLKDMVTRIATIHDDHTKQIQEEVLLGATYTVCNRQQMFNYDLTSNSEDTQIKTFAAIRKVLLIITEYKNGLELKKAIPLEQITDEHNVIQAYQVKAYADYPLLNFKLFSEEGGDGVEMVVALTNWSNNADGTPYWENFVLTLSIEYSPILNNNK